MKRVVLFLFLFLTSVNNIFATNPIGNLEVANDNVIVGWAKDPDFNGPISVHIYVDGAAVKAVLADQNRSDVGNHVFSWNHESFGPGTHIVKVYAIGVDSSGTVDSNNPEFGSITFSLPTVFPLSSTDGSVKVVFDSKFGGAITQLFDYPNMGNLNLIDNNQGGAMFQTAFWILPYHPLPPGCADRNDMKLDNPTQAGFIADGLAGNPIGVFGTTLTRDPDEFIRYEDNGKTVHFKNRFIRFDYCQQGGATMDKRQWWDTDFYIEQWASFRSDLPNTLTLKSKLIYVGTNPKSVTTRQMPVIFARHLPLVAYWKDGMEKTDYYLGVSGVETPSFNPDKNWAAMISSTNNKTGIGMVAAPSMTAMLNKNRFMFGEFPDGGENTNTLFFGSGVPDLRNTGVITNVDYDEPSGHVFTFNPGGTFEWTVYYPIGKLSTIKQNAETLLTNTANFGMAIPTTTPTKATIVGDYDTNGTVNLADFGIWKTKYLEGQMTLADFAVWKGEYLK